MTSEIRSSNPEYDPSAQEHLAAEGKEAPVKPPEDDRVTPEKESARERYDLAKAVDNPLVKKYQPKFLARGGEHIIYDIPGHPDIVAKVEASVMVKIQKYNAKQGVPLDTMSPEVLPRVQEIIGQNQERYARLKKHFGAEHVLGMKQALVKIPVTETLLEQLHAEPLAGAKDAKESWAIVRVQKRAPEFQDPERRSVVAGYAEKEGVDPDVYGRVTRALAEGDPQAAYTPEEFRSLLPKQFKDLLEKAEHDEQLAGTLRDFVEKTFAYVEETGEILDLAGTDNVTVFQKDGQWNYRLVDALYPTGTNPGRTRMMEAARESVAKAAQGEDDHQQNLVYNTINFVRAMNGMARQLGVERQANLVSEADRGKIDFLKHLENQYKKS